MLLSHYTKDSHLQPLKKIHPGAQISHMKPNGLWLSDDSDYGWFEWCCDNTFRVEEIRFRNDFEVDIGSILWLKTVEELLTFTAEYQDPDGSMNRIMNDMLTNRGSVWEINWKRVAEKYNGILITPYIYECRHNPITSWYYGWDVASACIWNPECLKSTGTSNTQRLLSKV